MGGKKQAEADVGMQAPEAGRVEGTIMSRGGGGLGGRLFGILGFIGVVVLLNVLSQAFDWGFYFY